MEPSLHTLTPSFDLAAFFERVARAPARLLMLDYDGTLAPFHVRPECAVPYPEVNPVLRDIVQSGGTRVVIVSGRPADEVPRLLGMAEQRPEIWGSHGWERLYSDGRRVVEEPAAEARRALAAAVTAVEAVMPRDSRLEHKLASIALHWRGVPPEAAEDLKRGVANVWTPIAAAGAVEMLPFDGGLELRTVGCNKQYAVKAILSETAENCAIAYLGDDITDEDAFRAVKTRGVGVLVRPQFRETGADVWIQPPHELVEFMRPWAVEQH
jgi:trehalose 6-phosphate phosphatase